MRRGALPKCAQSRQQEPDQISAQGTFSSLQHQHQRPRECVQGQWWLPGAQRQDSTALSSLAAQAGGQRGSELLQLATQHRMVTDAQRAAFCCLMGAVDAEDAANRLLQLRLKAGPQSDQGV